MRVKNAAVRRNREKFALEGKRPHKGRILGMISLVRATSRILLSCQPIKFAHKLSAIKNLRGAKMLIRLCSNKLIILVQSLFTQATLLIFFSVVRPAPQPSNGLRLHRS